MNFFKRFSIVFMSMLPFSAGAAVPWLIGGVAGVGAIAGFSIYRSFVPVNMSDSLSFFSSCWSCQMFGDVMATLSSILPKIYKSVGIVTIPVVVGLLAIWLVWNLLKGYLRDGKQEDGWTLGGMFGTKVIKLTVVILLLAFPLPRFISDVIVEPVFNIGFTVGRAINTDFQVGTVNENQFETCLVATAVADPAAVTAKSAASGAFSPKLRHNLTCQLAGIHQMTALGMTAGFTMLNMAFSNEYMHKIMWGVPIFPNVPVLLAGALLMILFFFALLPVPLYLLKVIIDLSIDLVMLPLTLISWLFDDWKIFNTKSLTATVDDLIKNVAGIAMVGIFVAFSVIFMNAVFGSFDGIPVLVSAFQNNDPKILMDGLMMNNNSLISLVLMGIFLAMFMTMIPKLIESLFASVKVPQEFYDNAQKDIKSVYGNTKKWYQSIRKATGGKS